MYIFRYRLYLRCNNSEKGKSGPVRLPCFLREHEIFYAIEVELVRGGGLWRRQPAQIGFERYCSFESKYQRRSLLSVAGPTLPSQLCLSLFISDFSPPLRLSLSLSLSLSLASPRIFSSYLQKFACKSGNECVSVRITNRKRFSYSPFIKSEPTRTHRGRTLDPISASAPCPFYLFPLCFPSTCVFVLPSFLPSFLLYPSLHFYMLAAAGSARLYERNKSSST